MKLRGENRGKAKAKPRVKCGREMTEIQCCPSFGGHYITFSLAILRCKGCHSCPHSWVSAESLCQGFDGQLGPLLT